MSSEQWCLLTTLQGSFEEDQLCSYLRANGISTSTRGETLRRTHAMVMDGLGRVEILVPPEQLEVARDLLEKVESGALRLEGNEEEISPAG